MKRVEDIAITVDDFRSVAGSPKLTKGVPGFESRVIGASIAPQPSARFWALLEGDAIETVVPLCDGDRVVSLESDIVFDLGYTRLDLVERANKQATSLLVLGEQRPASKQPFAVRRTIGADAHVTLRITAELSDSGHARRVFGCYLRVVRAS